MVTIWKPLLAALVIFAAGVVTGGLTVSLVRVRAPQETRPTTAPGPWAPPRSTPGERGSNLSAAPGPGQLPYRLRVLQRGETELRDLSRRMSRQLDLTEPQRERIEAILRESQLRMQTVADEVIPRTREEFRRTRERIREELSPAQRRKFEELFAARENRLRRISPPAVPTSETR